MRGLYAELFYVFLKMFKVFLQPLEGELRSVAIQLGAFAGKLMFRLRQREIQSRGFQRSLAVGNSAVNLFRFKLNQHRALAHFRAVSNHALYREIRPHFRAEFDGL